MTTHKIIIADSSNLSQIPDGQINLIVTSPPYPMVEMWDEMFCADDPEIQKALEKGDGCDAFERMHNVLASVWKECDRVLAESGFLCINIGDATRTLKDTFRLYSNHTMIIRFFSGLGYCLLPDIHWRKPSNSPTKFMGSGMYPAGAYVTYEHEYILIFRKGEKRDFKGEEKTLRRKSAYFWEERNVWFSDLWDIKGTGQELTRETDRKRSAAFPLEIPYRLVNMYSAEGDTVLDPFCGLGTTTLACIAANRNSIGAEKNAGIAKLAIDRIGGSLEMINALIDARIKNHGEFIQALPAEKSAKCYTNIPHGFPVVTKQETELQIQKLLRMEQNGGAFTCTYQ